MNTIYIYHHLGMGDHILCNGLVRHYAEKYDRIYLFIKPMYFSNVAFMYRDCSKIKLISMDDNDIRLFMEFNSKNNYLIVGHTKEWFNKLDNAEFETFDVGFYESQNLPISYKWDKFYFERDINSELNAYHSMGLSPNEKYIFVHDDEKRNRIFKPELFNSLKAIKPINFTNIGIFDFIYTIEHAEEVHVMNSSFVCLIDTMQIKHDKLFYHNYARTDMQNELGKINPKFKLNWKFLE